MFSSLKALSYLSRQFINILQLGKQLPTTKNSSFCDANNCKFMVCERRRSQSWRFSKWSNCWYHISTLDSATRSHPTRLGHQLQWNLTGRGCFPPVGGSLNVPVTMASKIGYQKPKGPRNWSYLIVHELANMAVNMLPWFWAQLYLVHPSGWEQTVLWIPSGEIEEVLRRVNAGGSLRQRIINSMSGMLGKDQAWYDSLPTFTHCFGCFCQKTLWSLVELLCFLGTWKDT